MGFDEWLKSLGYSQIGNEDDGYRWAISNGDRMRFVRGNGADNSTGELDELRAQWKNTLTDEQGRPIYGSSGYNFEPESGNMPINGMSQVDPSQYTPEVINAAAQYGINLTPQYDPQYGYVIPQQSLAQWANIISPESWFDQYGPALIQGAAMGGVGLYNAGLSAAGGAGWTSGYDLPMGNDLLSATGAGVPAGVNLTQMAPAVEGTFNGINAGGSLGLQAGGTGLGFAPELGASISAIPAATIAPSSILPAALAGPVAAALASGAGSALGNAAVNTATSAATKSFLDRIIGGAQSGDWGEVLGGLGQGAVSVGPALAAINYARNQDPFNTSNLQSLYSQTPTNYQFDTSKLTDAYNQFNPATVTGQYDLNTGQGRGALADSLSARGVAGSSFGNMDLTNYGMVRDVGRQQLINDATMKRAGIAESLLGNDRATAALNLQGINAKANLANSMLGADVKEREMKNNLYGRALLALSGGLTPAKSLLWGQ